jgi:hypothetical protein
MPLDNGAIIKRLLQVEAWAAGLQEECYKTRKLIEKEEGVSTLPKDRPGLSELELEHVAVKFRKRILKKQLQK